MEVSSPAHVVPCRHSDNKPHKVTIAILEMAANMRHFCAPALAQLAYLQSNTTNTSQYTLLASDKVNVFVGMCASLL